VSSTLRPLSLSEIIDTAFKIYTRNWRTLITVVGIVIVPAAAASFLVLSSAPVPDLSQYVGDPAPAVDKNLLEESIPFLRAALLAGLIQLVGAMLAAAGSMRAVAEVYLGSTPDWRASLAAAWRRLPAVLLTGVLIVGAMAALMAGIFLLTGLAAAGGSGGLVTLAVFVTLLIIPWLAVSWSPAIPVLVVERATPTGALTRSFSLVRGRWWPTFGTILTAWLIVVVLSSIASRILQAFLPAGENLVAGLVISTGISVATTPFIVAVLAVLYFDLRARHEGFDLERLAGDVGITPPPFSSHTDRPAPLPPTDEPDWPPLPPDADQPPPAE
jgi:hypothetical protein